MAAAAAAWLRELQPSCIDKVPKTKRVNFGLVFGLSRQIYGGRGDMCLPGVPGGNIENSCLEFSPSPSLRIYIGKQELRLLSMSVNGTQGPLFCSECIHLHFKTDHGETLGSLMNVQIKETGVGKEHTYKTHMNNPIGSGIYYSNVQGVIDEISNVHIFSNRRYYRSCTVYVRRAVDLSGVDVFVIGKCKVFMHVENTLHLAFEPATAMHVIG
ncbi:hypothetical protein HOLleu_34836 [Holothuria leucospilota]|uniref:Uncharacterized protein n=1 Tax=Holothuria leucospilota TaxID=206669 RepID=A0A9Q1BFM9_HOLLE|nr:hypothetical protein HOLleu_34836 [Holothuria leucospilota]